MSTRACIKVKARMFLTDKDLMNQRRTPCEIILYHHHDGYPSGVGSDLKKYLADNASNCGWWNPESIATDLVRGAIVDSEGLPDFGYKCAIAQHGDCDYGYLIDCDAKTLKCYRLGYEVMDWKEENLVEIPDKAA